MPISEKITERIKFETELLKMTALATLAIGGGTLGLLLGKLTLFRIILAGSGLITTIGLIGALWWQRRYILMLIEQIRED